MVRCMCNNFLSDQKQQIKKKTEIALASDVHVNQEDLLKRALPSCFHCCVFFLLVPLSCRFYLLLSQFQKKIAIAWSKPEESTSECVVIRSALNMHSLIVKFFFFLFWISNTTMSLMLFLADFNKKRRSFIRIKPMWILPSIIFTNHNLLFYLIQCTILFTTCFITLTLSPSSHEILYSFPFNKKKIKWSWAAQQITIWIYFILFFFLFEAFALSKIIVVGLDVFIFECTFISRLEFRIEKTMKQIQSN